MTEEQRINDLIDKLDHFMENGGGHMNIEVNDLTDDEIQVKTHNSLICNKDMACSIPTLHKGFDDDL